MIDSCVTAFGRGGVSPLPALPTWAAAAAVNQIIAIPNSQGGGGAPLSEYSSVAVDFDNAVLYSACAGGHNLTDNRVTKLDIGVNSPTGWVTLRGPSTTPVQNAEYYDVGDSAKQGPCSRHIYTHNHFVKAPPTASYPSGRRGVMMFGTRYGYGGGTPSFYKLEFFDINSGASGAWDYPTAWPSIPGNAGHGRCFDSKNQRCWTNAGTRFSFNATTGEPQWDSADYIFYRYPLVYDRLRERLFGMQSSDGEGPGTLYHSYRDLIANTSVGVSFDTPGTTVRNALESAALGYAGMDHDYLNDFFLYIDSYNPGVIYKVTPNGNSDTGWKMEIFTPAAGSTSIWSSGSLVMMGHVRYIEKLRGFLIYTDAVNRPMYYLRTSL